MSLTDDQRERHVCCLKRHLCKDDHFHERDVVRLMAEAWETCRAKSVADLFPLRPEDNPYRKGDA